MSVPDRKDSLHCLGCLALTDLESSFPLALCYYLPECQELSRSPHTGSPLGSHRDWQ